MKRILIFLCVLLPVLGLTCLGFTGCLPKALEEELNIVFMNEGEIVASGSVTQFRNIKTPAIDEAYIPEGYKFYGWTAYSFSDLNPAAADFKSKMIGGGKMLHYMDVKGHEDNRTVVMQAVIIDKNLVPKEYHYTVLAWYDKVATSGISQEQMDTLTAKLQAYLAAEGVSEEDIGTLVIRGYTGNVGPSVGQIMADEDVDIMLGWGSADNVTSTGGMPASMLLESRTFSVVYNGATKNRTIHRLTDSESVLKVWAWLQSEECTAIFQ